MRCSTRISILVVVLATLMGLPSQTGALATSAGGAIGTGTIMPGLSLNCTTPPQTQTVTFDSAILVYTSTNGPTVAATAATHFAGASTGCETVVKGQGTGTLSGGLAGIVGYTRVGNIVTLNGNINGENIFAGVCIFVPTTFLFQPATSYGLVCVAATS